MLVLDDWWLRAHPGITSHVPPRQACEHPPRDHGCGAVYMIPPDVRTQGRDSQGRSHTEEEADRPWHGGKSGGKGSKGGKGKGSKGKGKDSKGKGKDFPYGQGGYHH